MIGNSRASQQQEQRPAPPAIPPPFVGSGAGHYFTGDDERQQKLDLLTHLLPYGGVFVVMGEQGIGKTALLQHLQSRLSESCRFCRLNAEDCGDTRELVHKILDCFAWRSDVERSLGGTQLRAVREHLGILRRNGYAPVLMIDDAEGLSDTAFEVLEQLFEDDDPNLLTLLLAGGETLKKRLASPLLQPLNVHIAHELRLVPLSPAEQADYIRARLAWAGIDDMGPFHAATLKFIYAASRGVPRRVNELAQVFWDNKKDPQAPGASEKRRRQWLGQLRYIAPIVLISLGVALFNEPIRTALFSASPPQPQPTTATTQAPPAVASAVSRSPAGEPSAPTPARNGHDASADKPAAVAATGQRSAGESTARGAVSPSLEASTDATLAQNGNDNAIAEAAVTATPGQPPAEKPAAPGAVSMPPPAPVTETPTDEGPAVAVADTQAEAVETTPANMAAIIEDVRSRLAPQAPPRQRQAGIAAAVPDEGQWWLSQPPDQYAIQLIAIDARAAERYVQQHDLGASVNPFRVKRPDGDLIALAVGPIAGRPEAAAEALRWQQRLPDIQPWVRTVASIQQAVRRGESPSASEWLARVKANEQQLLQFPPKDYAVQLLAMDREGVTGFVTRHGLTGKVVYFRTRVNGQERYAALMGRYADRDQALAAGHRLAAEIGGIHPWVRSLASVQEVIRDYDHHPR